MQISVMGIGWYEREDYPRILEIMEDADKLPRTYDEFLKSAETGERNMTSKGHVVVRAIIKPDEFLAYCRRNGLKVDAQARMRFGSEAARDFVMKQQQQSS